MGREFHNSVFPPPCIVAWELALFSDHGSLTMEHVATLRPAY